MRITLDQELLNAAYRPYLLDQHRYQIYFGGAGSGKSVFLATRCVLDALQGRNTLVVRQVARTIRGSCLNEILKAMHRLGLENLFKISRTDSVITAKTNGAQILFAGLDDPEKLKSITPAKGVLTDIWLEEATESDYHSFKQLDKRLRGESRHLKRFTLSFNPIDREHWLYREFFDIFPDQGREAHNSRVSILKTTYKDNRFLTKEDVEALEGEKDPYYLRVYTYGDWGVRAGAIFTNWRTEALTGNETGETRYGLDFGFAHDPAAIVKVRFDASARRVYVMEEFLQTGCTNARLSKVLSRMAGTAPVWCDSAEPKSIQELRLYGISAFGVRKGPDSILHAIQWLQGMKIIVNTSCPQTRREMAGYVWKTGREGNCTPVPKGGDDHLLDALRYALENDMTARLIRTGRKEELGL